MQDSGPAAGYLARMPFVLDSRIAASSHPLAQLELCEARLQDDARFPWIVLIPRQADRVELGDLDPAARAQLLVETLMAGEAVRAAAEAAGRPIQKLNHGQLGNLVPQFHVHVVGRRSDDAAWPGPVWGVGRPRTYREAALETALAAARAALA